MRVPIQIHVSLCFSLRSRNFFTHRAVVATSAQCFGIGTRIHFEQLREDCVSALSFGRINSIRETNEICHSCNSCKRLVPSRLHELHEFKLSFVSRIEFTRSKLTFFTAHVTGVGIASPWKRRDASHTVARRPPPPKTTPGGRTRVPADRRPCLPAGAKLSAAKLSIPATRLTDLVYR